MGLEPASFLFLSSFCCSSETADQRSLSISISVSNPTIDLISSSTRHRRRVQTQRSEYDENVLSDDGKRTTAHTHTHTGTHRPVPPPHIDINTHTHHTQSQRNMRVLLRMRCLPPRAIPFAGRPFFVDFPLIRSPHHRHSLHSHPHRHPSFLPFASPPLDSPRRLGSPSPCAIRCIGRHFS